MIVLNGQTDIYLDARHDSCSFVTCPTPYMLIVMLSILGK